VSAVWVILDGDPARPSTSASLRKWMQGHRASRAAPLAAMRYGSAGMSCPLCTPAAFQRSLARLYSLRAGLEPAGALPSDPKGRFMTEMFRAIVFGAMVVASTPALSQAPALTFGLIGDLGYGPAEEPLLQNVLDDLNSNALAFVVHRRRPVVGRIRLHRRRRWSPVRAVRRFRAPVDLCPRRQ
jgi:hypothetical protein